MCLSASGASMLHRGRATSAAPAFCKIWAGPWLPLLASSRRGGASQGASGSLGRSGGDEDRDGRRKAEERMEARSGQPVTSSSPGRSEVAPPREKGAPAGPRHARSRNPGRAGTGWGGAGCALLAGVPTISGASGMPLAGPAPPPLCLRGAQGCTGLRGGLRAALGPVSRLPRLLSARAERPLPARRPAWSDLGSAGLHWRTPLPHPRISFLSWGGRGRGRDERQA